MGRFTVVDAPVLQPAVDYVTKTSVGPFIDTGTDIKVGDRKFGRIYLSIDTVAEMARELGIIGTEGASEEAEAAAYARGQLDALKETLGGDLVRVVRNLEHLLDALRAPELAAGQSAEAVR